MRTETHSRKSPGFTLVEMLALVAVTFLLSTLLLSGLAKAKIKSPATGCLSNLHQLMVAWDLYRDDNSGILVPNIAEETGFTGWVQSSVTEGWNALPGNTNVSSYTHASNGGNPYQNPFTVYFNNDVSIYKCPGDIVPSANGQRLRSYSMNCQVGAINSYYNPGYRLFSKMSDIVGNTPAGTFVFCDESPLSINDAYFQTSLASPAFPDIPACYLDGACGFSFADGHAEIRKWVTTTLQISVRYGYTASYPAVGGGALNTDWNWLQTRSSCLNQ